MAAQRVSGSAMSWLRMVWQLSRRRNAGNHRLEVKGQHAQEITTTQTEDRIGPMEQVHRSVRSRSSRTRIHCRTHSFPEPEAVQSRGDAAAGHAVDEKRSRTKDSTRRRRCLGASGCASEIQIPSLQMKIIELLRRPNPSNPRKIHPQDLDKLRNVNESDPRWKTS